MRRDLVIDETFRRFGDLGEQETQAIDRRVEPDQGGAIESRLARPLPERQTGDALHVDREARAFDRKFLMIGVETESRGFAVVVNQGQEAFAAEIEGEPRVRNRPMPRDNGARREKPHAVPIGPWSPERDRDALGRPILDTRRFAHAPQSELRNSGFQAREALRGREVGQGAALSDVKERRRLSAALVNGKWTWSRISTTADFPI